LIGPNGAGKTTTIHIILGLLKPDEGEVYVDGVNMLDDKKAAEIRRCIGFAPQNTALDYFLTVEDNIEIYLKLNGVSKGERGRKVDWVLDVMGLAEYRKRRVETLSGGLARRVHIARALALEPRLIILDEPTIGLDPVSRRSFWEGLNRYMEESDATLLWSSHYLEEIERQADRVILINKGRIVMDAPPSEIMSRMSSPILEIEIEAKDVSRDMLEDMGGSYIDGRLVFENVELSGIPRILERLRDAGVRVRSVRWGSRSLEELYLEMMSL